MPGLQRLLFEDTNGSLIGGDCVFTNVDQRINFGNDRSIDLSHLSIPSERTVFLNRRGDLQGDLLDSFPVGDNLRGDNRIGSVLDQTGDPLHAKTGGSALGKSSEQTPANQTSFPVLITSSEENAEHAKEVSKLKDQGVKWGSANHVSVETRKDEGLEKIKQAAAARDSKSKEQESLDHVKATLWTGVQIGVASAAFAYVYYKCVQILFMDDWEVRPPPSESQYTAALKSPDGSVGTRTPLASPVSPISSARTATDPRGSKDGGSKDGRYSKDSGSLERSRKDSRSREGKHSKESKDSNEKDMYRSVTRRMRMVNDQVIPNTPVREPESEMQSERSLSYH